MDCCDYQIRSIRLRCRRRAKLRWIITVALEWALCLGAGVGFFYVLKYALTH